MGSDLADEIADLRAMVLRVLCGDLTEEDDPAFFGDDVFFIGCVVALVIDDVDAAGYTPITCNPRARAAVA